MNILVTGATGKVGREVVRQLRAAGVEARALVRDPDSAGLPGTELVRGDFSVPETVTAALTGIDTVFLVWPFTTLDAAPAIVDALAAGARRVVYLSAAGVGEAQDDLVTNFHAGLERLIEESTMDWTFLRPTGFAGNTLGWAEEIRAEHVVRWVYGEAARSLIDERDIAAVAVRALTESGHGGKKYVLSGPEAVSQIEQATIIGDVIGRPVRFEEISPEAARAKMIADGWPREFAEGALEFWAELLTQPELVTSTVEDVTGAPARSFAQWAENHARDFSAR